jgi:ElaB/YqjD/DUF883 family membrane-anchored ribosome-binding protein
MTEPTPITASRDALRGKIEAAERRNAERTLADQAREAAGAAADYTRAHPLTVIGGAVAVGLMIGLLTRPGRRVAGKALHGAGDAISGAASSASAGVKGIAARGGSKIGTLFGEAALAYIMTVIDELVDTARTGQDRVGELGDAAGAQAKKLRDGAGDAAESAATGSRDLMRSARDGARRMVADLARRTRR